MTKRAQLPDGTILEFPDETPDAVMDKAVKSHIGGSQNGVVASFGDALQHHLMSPLHGAAQLVEHGVNAAANALLPQPEQTMSGLVSGQRPQAHGLARVRQAINDTVAADDAALAQREANYQARTPDGLAASGGALIGEVAPWMYGLGELRAAGLLPKIAGTGVKATLKKGAVLAAEGGTIGATQPVTDGGSFAAEKARQIGVGAAAAPVLGAGTAVAGKAAGAAGRLARYATDSGREQIANSRLARLYGVDDATLARLEQQPPVSGFSPTPAQAIGTPEAVQAERILRNNGTTAPAFAARESQNNAALRDQVARVAGTDAQMAAARKARSAATDPYYAKLKGQRVPVVSVVDALDALQNSGLGVRPNIKSAVTGLKAEIASRAGQDGMIPADILSGLHENAGSHLGPMASAQEKVALAPIKNAIADALDGAVPGYRANLAAYSAHSQPLNDMAAGRALLDAIDRGGRDAGGNQSVDLSKVRALLAKDDKAKFPMSPQARKAIEDVMEAIQKRGIANNTIAASGPGTAADTLRGLSASPAMLRVAGHLASAGGGFFAGLPGYALGALSVEGANAANNSVLRKLGTKAADSKLTAEAIRAAREQEAKRQMSPLLRLLLPYEQRALPRP